MWIAWFNWSEQEANRSVALSDQTNPGVNKTVALEMREMGDGHENTLQTTAFSRK